MRSKLIFLFLMVCLPFSTSFAWAQDVNDPCPKAIDALSASRGDLSDIQADIDRFTLCVERAQLLKRLNDLALENEDDLMDLNMDGPGFEMDSNPFANIPTFDPSILQERDETEFQEPSNFNINDWVILSIFGTGKDLNAKIARRDGSLAQVQTGDSLPDGTRISSVTATSVTLSANGELRTLTWFESGS